MKKLLILGGANVHCKLVEAAKSLGCYVIVADYLEDSPAKKMADKSYLVSIRDVDALVNIARQEKVDGVLSTHLDPCQRPYQEVCSRLGLPCYCTSEQVFRMTDKKAFKQMCVENGVDVIEEYSETDVENGRVRFPVFVKPVDSRGSRGQYVCHSVQETKEAILEAKKESSNGQVIIERYMQDCQEIQVTYFFVNGKAHLIRTADSYGGNPNHSMEKVVACSVSPSKHTDEYLESAHEKVVNMFRKMGFRNGPIFMQGFYDCGKFRFFDPGIRFPGVEYEKLYNRLCGFDLMEMMVEFALYGEFRHMELPEDLYRIKGNRAAILFPTISAGTLSTIQGIEELNRDSDVISFTKRYQVGDTVEWAYNVNQRFAEIVVLSNGTAALKKKLSEIQETLILKDGNGLDMTFERFDVARIGGNDNEI